MDLKDILLHVKNNNTLLIQINRPKAYNALRTNTLKEIAWALANVDENIKVVVITGDENAFAAGADIKELEAKGTVEGVMDKRTEYWKSIQTFKLPLIAVVNGFCLGGGCELAMSCDIIVAGDNAKFGQPEINLGIIPGAGGTQRSVKAMGKSNAMLLLLTGDFIDAKRAKEIHLISEVLPAKSTLIRALEIAKAISFKSTLATTAIKKAVLNSYDEELSSSLEFEKALFCGILSTEDKKEGIEAFNEKRKPKFKGK